MYVFGIGGVCVGVALVVAGVTGNWHRKLACTKSAPYPSLQNQTTGL